MNRLNPILSDVIGSNKLNNCIDNLEWATNSENLLYTWFSSNPNAEVHAYVKNGKYAVVNNTYEPLSTTIYRGDGSSFDLDMKPNDIIWYQI